MTRKESKYRATIVWALPENKTGHYSIDHNSVPSLMHSIEYAIRNGSPRPYQITIKLRDANKPGEDYDDSRSGMS